MSLQLLVLTFAVVIYGARITHYLQGIRDELRHARRRAGTPGNGGTT